jgi:hypothetical protein
MSTDPEAYLFYGFIISSVYHEVPDYDIYDNIWEDPPEYGFYMPF